MGEGSGAERTQRQPQPQQGQLRFLHRMQVSPTPKQRQLRFLHGMQVVPTPSVVSPVSEVLSREAPALATSLARAMPGHNQWHVKGYRYRARDGAMGIVR